MEGDERIKLALGLAAIWAAACGSGPGPTQPMDLSMSVVPVLSPALGDGGGTQIGLRLVTSFGLVDGTSIEASIDTGSSGIQLLANLLPGSVLAGLERTGASVEGIYPASGIQASGYVANATVTFGDTSSPSTIPVAVFDRLSCVPGSICSLDAGALEPYLFNGLPCLLGLGMRSSGTGGLGNPIVQLPGKPAFIIEAPAFGADAGRLRIAPADEEIAAYQLFQLPSLAATQPLQNGAPAWNDLAVPACVDDLSTNTSYCAGALLDTGTPLIEMAWTGESGIFELPHGSRMTVDIGPDGGPLGQFSLTIGSPPQFGLDEFLLAPPLQDLGQLVILGLPVFSRYNVLFDQARGRIGLLAH